MKQLLNWQSFKDIAVRSHKRLHEAIALKQEEVVPEEDDTNTSKTIHLEADEEIRDAEDVSQEELTNDPEEVIITTTTEDNEHNGPPSEVEDDTTSPPEQGQEMETGEPDKTNSCTSCDETFEYPQELTDHVKSQHPATLLNPYTCDLCNKSFKGSWNLKAHKVTHSSDRPFSCEICGKGFKTIENYKMHVWKHKGEKNHECSVCHKTFYLPSELRNHAKRHDPGKKSYSCTHCTESFYNSSNLKDHMQRHTGRCRMCVRSVGMDLSEQSNLRTIN